MTIQKRSKLATAILRDGRTQTQIALDAGLDPCTLSLVINGRRCPRIETSIRLSNALHCAPRDLGLPDIASLIGGIGGIGGPYA
jgi:transcriptional regulator with XRE-family HTH domain